MSNVLVIKAHPLTKNESRTLTVLDAFLTSYEESHPNDTVEVLDVYENHIPEIDKDILTGWANLKDGKEINKVQAKKIERFSELTEQFLNSDKIIIANPLWNLNIPTRLKAWIDTIVVAGKTFKYTENGKMPLAPGKKMLHIQASGGIHAGEDTSSKFVKEIFNFIGVEETDAIIIEGLDYQPEKADEILQGIMEETKELAKQF